MTQEAQILSYLKTGRTLTPIEALDRFGCFRLAARVYRLKDAGWPIHCDRREVENGKRVGRYSLDQDRRKWPQ